MLVYFNISIHLNKPYLLFNTVNDSNATNGHPHHAQLGPGLILAPAAAALAAAAGADGVEPSVVVQRGGGGGVARNGATNGRERGLLDLAFSTSIFTQGASRPTSNNPEQSNGEVLVFD